MLNRVLRLSLFLLFLHSFLYCQSQEVTNASARRYKRYQYDTNYVMTFRDQLHLSFLLATRGADINVYKQGNKGDHIKYTSNNRLNIGFGIDYKWLSLETTFKDPFFHGDPERGNTKVFNLKANFVRQNFWFTGQLQSIHGYYTENTGASSNPPKNNKDAVITLRPDIRQTTAYITGNYIFNNQKFSYKAYLTQFQRQLRSAGSFVMGATYARYGFRADSSILPEPLQPAFHPSANIKKSTVTHFGFNIGYLHTFVIRKKVFIHLGLLPSLGIRKTELAFADLSKPQNSYQIGLISDSRFAVGRNGDKSYYGININVLTLNDNADERIKYTYQFVKLFYGRRF